MMTMPRFGLELLLLLLLLRVNQKQTSARVRPWPVSPKYNDDDDNYNDKVSMPRLPNKNNKEKGKEIKFSIPDDLFDDEEGTKHPSPPPPPRTTKFPSNAPSVQFVQESTDNSTPRQSSVQPVVATFRPTPAETSSSSPDFSTLGPTQIPPTFVVLSPVTIVPTSPEYTATAGPLVPTNPPSESTSSISLPPTVPANDQIDCSMDSMGMFGTSSNDDASSEIVSYKYQVETVGMMDERTLSKTLLKLEYAMTEQMIPLFRECQNSAVTIVRSAASLLKDGERLSGIVSGVSVAPADEINTNALCRNVTVVDTGLCFVMDGQLTIYFSSRLELNLSDTVRQKMYQEIQSDQFISVDPAISKVGLYETTESVSSPKDPQSYSYLKGQNTLQPLVGTMVVLVVTVTMFAVILIRRQWGIRRQSSDEATTALHIAR